MSGAEPLGILLADSLKSWSSPLFYSIKTVGYWKESGPVALIRFSLLLWLFKGEWDVVIVCLF